MQISPKSIGASQLTMLLSFERPARRRRLGVSRPRPPGAERLFADLENCTVANEIGYQGEDFGLHFGEAISLGRRSRLYRRENREIPPRERPPGFFPITVKIVRAHGGC